MEKDSRPKIPEDRSCYNARASVVPLASMSKFDNGDVAWLTIASRRSIEVVIAKTREKGSGKYEYQVEEENGSLYKDGKWVAEADLSLAK